MKTFLSSVFALALTATLHAQNQAEVTSLLKQLQSQDVDLRHNAMSGLQTSLDPRVPDACLPVLTMEGDSIRRLAARAIGSRWHQIPKERVPQFTAALKAQLDSGHAGLVNMARRGIALLTRDFTDPMLSRSHNKRWVVYERYGLPCLIDTSTMTEELMGFGNKAGWMSCSWGNTELAPTVKWHPKKDMMAIDIVENRRVSTIWTWVHGKGLRQFRYEELIKTLGYDQSSLALGIGTEFGAWSGDNLEFDLTFTVIKGTDYIDHKARMRWNSAADKLSVLSDEIQQ